MGVVVPSMSTRMAAGSGSGPLMPSLLLAGKVRRPEAHRLETLVHAALGVAGRPPGGVLEEPDGPDVALGAEVEPVPRPAGHADQVPGLHLQRDHGTLRRMDVEH